MSSSSTEPSAITAPWRIGVDVGGTFTDIVLVDDTGALRVCKVPSTPEDPSVGVLNAVEAAAGELSLSSAELLGSCSHFMHASTVATNIVLERRGTRVGMLVTRGFRDSLEIRRGIRKNAWDHRTPFPPPLAQRYLRRPVGGRIDRRGDELEPLCKDDVREAIRTFRDESVSSIAICFFNSYLNDRHEREAAEFLNQEYPEAWLTLSSEVAPIMGEYERSSTAVLNAYVSPSIVSYVRRLADRLVERGLRGPFYVVQNNAGAMTVASIRSRAVALLLSGPAAGIGALSLYSRALDDSSLLSMEIGGTSCDVTLLSNGDAEVASEFELGGYHVGLPSIDIHSVGAGGGTIGGVDRAGLLFVGPRGAGADPGPAAYGRGGREPTITDAQLVLGRLAEGPLAGGGRTLDLALAQHAVERHVARPLGLSLEAAASGMLRLLDQQLFHAVQKISAERGYDPRKFILVSAGGAGPMHGSSVGRKLGSPAVCVPRLAGAFCALGMLNIPIKHELTRVFLGTLKECVWSDIDPIYETLETQARARLTGDGFCAATSRVVREIELRHPGQIGTVRVTVAGNEAADRARVRDDFLDAYERLYGHRDSNSPIEIAGLRIVGLGLFPYFELRAAEAAPGVPPVKSEREVYFDEAGGWVATRIYSGANLRPGASIEGPAIIEEATTSVILAPGDLCAIDRLGNFLIRFDEGARA
jgi:N-methylhydantoinase A